MKMRQSLDDLERAFFEEITLERSRRRSLIRSTEQRSFKRGVKRRHKHASFRFVVLVTVLVLTAAIVTVAMFRTLYILLG
jgi:hypothetical protein